MESLTAKEETSGREAGFCCVVVVVVVLTGGWERGAGCAAAIEMVFKHI